ncbi:MAG: DNA alkylation repair protein [Bacilli bacterium]|nr:DNA alkylation repair protein [Bacilli bacterium]
MKLENVKWDKYTYREFINYLICLGDKDYKKFHSSIANSKLDIIGIRMPILRNIAKEISKTNMEDYFKLISNIYYEEVMLYGLVLSNTDEELFDKYLNDFIWKIDNWAICDSFCSNIKVVKNRLGKYWIYINNLIDLDKEFQTRVSIIIMMNYYLNDNYIDRVLSIVSNIKSDYYYINMAISWLLSVAIINYKDKVMELLESGKLSKFVQNKTISKIRDSYRVDNETKELVTKYKVK